MSSNNAPAKKKTAGLQVADVITAKYKIAGWDIVTAKGLPHMDYIATKGKSTHFVKQVDTLPEQPIINNIVQNAMSNSAVPVIALVGGRDGNDTPKVRYINVNTNTPIRLQARVLREAKKKVQS